MLALENGEFGMEENLIKKTEQKIKQILISDLEIEPNMLAGCDSTTPLLGRGIGLDSVETLTLVAGIEREFDIQIDDDELTADLFQNIGSLVEYVLKKMTKLKGLQR